MNNSFFFFTQNLVQWRKWCIFNRYFCLLSLNPQTLKHPVEHVGRGVLDNLLPFGPKLPTFLPNWRPNGAKRAIWWRPPDLLLWLIHNKTIPAEMINMCSHSRIKTVASKAHNRRSGCRRESDMNTYEDSIPLSFLPSFLFIWSLEASDSPRVGPAFVLCCVYSSAASH